MESDTFISSIFATDRFVSKAVYACFHQVFSLTTAILLNLPKSSNVVAVALKGFIEESMKNSFEVCMLATVRCVTEFRNIPSTVTVLIVEGQTFVTTTHVIGLIRSKVRPRVVIISIGDDDEKVSSSYSNDLARCGYVTQIVALSVNAHVLLAQDTKLNGFHKVVACPVSSAVTQGIEFVLQTISIVDSDHVVEVASIHMHLTTQMTTHPTPDPNPNSNRMAKRQALLPVGCMKIGLWNLKVSASKRDTQHSSHRDSL